MFKIFYVFSNKFYRFIHFIINFNIFFSRFKIRKIIINLIQKFGLSDIQSTAILDMQLRRLAALEREKIEKEYEEIKKLIDSLIAILRNPDRILKIIVQEITQLKEKYGDKRKTKIYKQKLGDFSEEDLVPKEETIITITKTGYVKRVPRDTYKSQRRGGKGVLGMTTKDEDQIEQIVSSTTHDSLLFFTNTGKVFGTRAWEIPEASRQSKGQAIVNILNMDQSEKIMSLLALESDTKIKHLMLATRNGVVKKTALKEFANMRSSGLIAIVLKAKDELVAVHQTSGDDHIMLISRDGKSIRFPESNVRPMGRATTGMKGITLDEGDEVIAMEVFAAKVNQKRAGKGVKAAVVNDKTGKLAAAALVTQEVEQIIITGNTGQIIKLPLKNIPSMGRSTQGVIMMRFSKKTDVVAAMTPLQRVDDEEIQEIKED